MAQTGALFADAQPLLAGLSGHRGGETVDLFRATRPLREVLRRARRQRLLLAGLGRLLRAVLRVCGRSAATQNASAN